MITMFLLSMLVNIFIKVLVWLIKENMDGEPLSENKRAKINELVWLCRKLEPEAARAGCTVGGVQPAEWETMSNAGDDDE